MKRNQSFTILGLNGLGVLPTACIIKDGELLVMAEEERFTRIKGSYGVMPAKATKFCLDYLNIQLSDIDAITFGWDCKYYNFKMPFFLLKQLVFRSSFNQNSSNVFKVLSELIKYRSYVVKNLISEMLKSESIFGNIPTVRFINHHYSHAASSFYSSGFKEAHVLVIDGSGENKCTSIWKAVGTSIKEVKSFKIPDSLGWFYQSITEYLGFSPNNHEGKTMALAAYGAYCPKIYETFVEIISFDNKGNYRFNPKYSFAGKKNKGTVFSNDLEKLLGESRTKNNPITQHHKNIAFAAQNILETIVVNMVKDLISKNDFKGNICLAGGIGLNCKLNGEISKINGIKNVYIPPFTSDNGSALGSAQILSVFNGVSPKTPITHPYWGPEFSDTQIENNLKSFGLKYSKENNIAQKTAQLLLENKIVGWFQGRMEVGARALGARSILANPLNIDARNYINLRVKGRENWRPFAASILFEKRFDFFDSNLDSPFMALALSVKREMVEKIPAAVHIDGTTRPQLVKKETNALFWNLINYFGEETGCYALLNTSFNLNEEPIVCTPEQAIRSFFTSGIDYLAIGNFIVSKNND